ncbi:MAG TPA: hypothetical protein VLE73_05095 [Candidatus Saccharimonadales bacterium]|nr:hypothetical protein [Candidatus Saccharimonadales bacterium]
MDIFRKAALVMAATLFSITLFWFVMLMGLQHAIGSATSVKNALHDSGVYKTIVSDALAQAQKDQARQAEQPGKQEMDIPLSDSRVKAIVNNAFPPEYLETNINKTLDGVYAWLQGDSQQLAFSIDLQDAKIRLADGLASYVRDKAATLPACTAADLTTQQGSDFDAFNATCLPPGVDANAAANQAHDQIANGEFLKDTKLTASSIKNDKGQTLGEQLQQVPANYQRVHKAALYSGIVSLLLAAAIIALGKPWQSGARKAAIAAIVVGVSSVIIGWGTSAALNAVSSNPKVNEPLQQSLIKVVQSLLHEAQTWWIGLGIALLVAGIVTLVLTRRPKVQPEADKKPEQAVTTEAKHPHVVEEADTIATTEQPTKKPTDKKTA